LVSHSFLPSPTKKDGVQRGGSARIPDVKLSLRQLFPWGDGGGVKSGRRKTASRQTSRTTARRRSAASHSKTRTRAKRRDAQTVSRKHHPKKKTTVSRARATTPARN